MTDVPPVDRARVLAEALASFRERGAGPQTLDDVAGRLGADPGAIHYWFESEVELLGALMKTRQQFFIDVLIARFAELDGAGRKLRAVLELAIADHDATLWLELWRLALHDDRARQIRSEIVGRYQDLIGRLIAAGAEAGELDPRSVDRATLTLIALIDGLSLQATIGDRVLSPAKMADVSVVLGESLLGGFLEAAPAGT